MGAAGQNGKTMFRCSRSRAPAQAQQFVPRMFGIAMRLGRDFDLRLQELAADMAGRCQIGAFEQRIGGFRRCLQRLRVRQEIFLLDAELEQFVGREDGCILPGWNQNSGYAADALSGRI